LELLNPIAMTVNITPGGITPFAPLDARTLPTGQGQAASTQTYAPPSAQECETLDAAGLASRLAPANNAQLQQIGEDLDGTIANLAQREKSVRSFMSGADPSSRAWQTGQAELFQLRAQQGRLQAVSSRVQLESTSKATTGAPPSAREAATHDGLIAFRGDQVDLADTNQMVVQARLALNEASPATRPALQAALDVAVGELDGRIQGMQLGGLERAQRSDDTATAANWHQARALPHLDTGLYKGMVQHEGASRLAREVASCYSASGPGGRPSIDGVQAFSGAQEAVGRGAVRDSLFDHYDIFMRAENRCDAIRAKIAAGQPEENNGVVASGPMTLSPADEQVLQTMEALTGLGRSAITVCIDNVGAKVTHGAGIDAQRGPGAASQAAMGALQHADSIMATIGGVLPAVTGAVSESKLSEFGQAFDVFPEQLGKIDKGMQFDPARARPDPESALTQRAGDLQGYLPLELARADSDGLSMDTIRERAVSHALGEGAESRYFVAQPPAAQSFAPAAGGVTIRL
jgi:hypothetical protein